MNPDSDVTGVVLAGGHSRRFGDENKATARLDGEPLVRRVVETVSASTDRPTLIAVRTPEQRQQYEPILADIDVRFVRDTATVDGPLAGVSSAAKSASTDWLFVCGCDMPLLSARAIAWLTSQIQTGIEGIVPTVDPPWVEPLHAVYHRGSLLDALQSADRASMHSLIDELSSVVYVGLDDVPSHVPLERSVRNVNTKAELRALSQTR